VAIYHLSAKIVSREKGQSVVASAAYRSASQLHDARIDQTFDFAYKRGVEHAEILAPDAAPAWIRDRGVLWNTVERVERRKDAQLAREIEVALPVELSKEEQVELLRDFAQRAFVSKGMVVDLALHRDNPENPHGHLLLTTREVTPEGFGLKRRDWNTTEALFQWREQWAEVTNEHLARMGVDIRIDHRTLEAQGLDLTPGRKIGVSLNRQHKPGLPPRIAERVEEQRQIARENGERILSDPNVALKALTHHHATFTDHDLAKWLHTRTDGADQFRAAHLKITASRELIVLGRDDRGRTRYTSREMLEVERQMLYRAEQMTARPNHPVAKHRATAVLSQHELSEEQQIAFRSLTARGDLKALVGVAGSGKSRLLAAARQAWEAEGYSVKGAALSGIAAENLTLASGIPSRTLASLEYAWSSDRDPLTSQDVLVIDEAGMVGTRQLSRMLDAAAKARAKVVLVGDPEQLQAIEAGAAFRGILAESGAAELYEVRRQSQLWQRAATQQLAAGETRDAIAAYEGQGSIIQLATRENARSALLEKWAQDGQQPAQDDAWRDRDKRKNPASRLMLAYTRDDVRQLNELARQWRLAHGELGHSESVETERGRKEFAVGDRLYFLRNERSLGVKNGSLGTIENIRNGVLQVQLDSSGDRVLVDSRFYRDLDYGYAATVYKAQGSTVDRSYILATSHYDRHSAYVALSRHRESATVFYATEDFELPWEKKELTPEEGRHRFIDVLSRARPKELAHDYLDREPIETDHSMESIDAAQQQAAERWRQSRDIGSDAVRSRQHDHYLGQRGPEEELDL
jgi:Ti-type conjugative transfer relaxase TraA